MNPYSLLPISQDIAWKSLLQLRGRLPQSLILIGPGGVGKRRSAKALFQVLHCLETGSQAGKPCGHCAQCKKITEGNHPDLIEIKPENNTIRVEDLREMKKCLYFKPMDGVVRFIIIDDCHQMNVNSANTLLKTLEEPPLHTRFFLTTHERGLILPTILSRSQFLYFSPLPNETLLKLIPEINIPQNIEPLFLDLLAGGLSRLDMLTAEGVLEFLQNISAELNTRPQQARQPINWDHVVATADSIAGSEEKICLLSDVLLRHFRNQALMGADRGTFDTALVAANKALETVFLRERINRHANKKLISLSLALKYVTA